MPHLKCLVCRVRVRTPDSAVGEAHASCPDCGSPLEPVAALSELIGLQERQPAPEVPLPLDDPAFALEAAVRAMALQAPPPPEA